MTRKLGDSLASLYVPRLAASGTRWAFGTSGSSPRILWLPMCEVSDWAEDGVDAAALTGGEAKLTMRRGATRKASRGRGDIEDAGMDQPLPTPARYRSGQGADWAGC